MRYYLFCFFLLGSGPACLAPLSNPLYQVKDERSLQRSLSDLPLTEFGNSPESSLPFIIYFSGDGGLNSFTNSLCNYLAQKGIPIVVLNSQKYFWEHKTPEETTSDLITIVNHYSEIWKRDQFILAGFSFGASILPFLSSRLPQNIGKKMDISILINPDKNCDFEIHLSDMLNLGISKGKHDVIDEIQKSTLTKVRLFFSSDENSEVRESFQKTGLKTQVVQGNHHFDSGYEKLGDLILAEVKR